MEKDYDYGGEDSSSERSRLSLKRRRPSGDFAVGGSKARPQPRRSGLWALSCERDRDLEHMDLGELGHRMLAEGGDPPKVFACVPPSLCTVSVLSRLRHDFNIPDDVELYLPIEDYDAYTPPPGHLPIHVAAFDGGVRLPLHPTLRRALCAFGLAPMQLVPGFWRNLVGFLVLWREAAGSRPNLGEPGYREPGSEQPIPTSFGPQPEWANEEDNEAVMSFLASIKQAGYGHASLEGFPWERARVERSLLAIDAILGDLFFCLCSLFLPLLLYLAFENYHYHCGYCGKSGANSDGPSMGSFLRKCPIRGGPSQRIGHGSGKVSASPPPLKVLSPSSRLEELEARLGRSHGLPSSSASKLPPVVPSGSSTSTSSRSTVPPPRPSSVKGKGVLIAEKALPVPPKARKDSPSTPKQILPNLLCFLQANWPLRVP
ncbi:hypothetical protein LWI29_017877 [Acer saccharum]|uniref:Transposase (putative) gypsy type domain-containing protein n=1 Tax=Acer saccharum TaxID=4024 RepID=A0AA39T863_ACESA|nr:hypothetical protein LWI29_017877 [Acer saccharum]